MAKREKHDTLLNLRCSTDFRATLKAVAAMHGTSRSELIRSLVIQAATSRRPLPFVRPA